MQVSSIFHLPGKGTVLAGRVADERLMVGQPVVLESPGNSVRTRIHGIEEARTKRLLTTAREGAEIAVQLPAVDFGKLADGVARGDDGTLEPVALTLRAAPKPWWQFW